MFPAWLTRSVGCKDQRSRTGRSPRRLGRLPPRLALEHLEGRDLPSFIAPALYDTGRGPYGLAVGDLRGNGRFDVVTANAFGTSVSVLLGNGDGSFRTAVTRSRWPVPVRSRSRTDETVERGSAG